MKIAIIGAHGAGKTTLTKRAENATGLTAPTPTPMHNPVSGQLKSLQECSNAEMLQLSQRRYTERITQEQTHRDMISDGSVLHEWVYASVRLRLGIYPSESDEPTEDLVGKSQLQLVDSFAEEALAYATETYDEVFFLPVEFPLPREFAPISDRFQAEAQNRLRELLSNSSKPVKELTGTVEERLDQMLHAL